ncbi:MAG: hypothetical protein NDJ65_05680 [Paludibacteraceae bacterium]|nr:hypothetical protein [Paludibacteraceae bacterium]
MKKILFTLAATLTSIWAMSQFYVCKNGAVVYKIDDGIADSITFAKPSFSEEIVDVYYDGVENGHYYVDLGLTSGTKWATCNVGASKPEKYGDYYAWGETSTKVTYSWRTYKYGSGDHELIKYCSRSDCGKDGFTDSKTTLDLSDDAAYVNWGGAWRMPTKAQQDELLGECYWVWTENYNNSKVKGCIVYKAKNSSDKGVKIYYEGTPSSSYKLSDAHIFLPAAGERYGGGLDGGVGADGRYLSSSIYVGYPGLVWIVQCNSDYMDSNYGGHRDSGLSVRAVIPGE